MAFKGGISGTIEWKQIHKNVAFENLNTLILEQEIIRVKWCYLDTDYSVIG